ncbi:16796_t:CDS:2, partial [Gigaspora margarita]
MYAKPFKILIILLSVLCVLSLRIAAQQHKPPCTVGEPQPCGTGSSAICCGNGLICTLNPIPKCCPSGRACGNSCCRTDQTCSNGASKSCGCPTGKSECGGACIDLKTDNNNCGTCGTK